ncbi:MAG: hypothetical protein ABUL72_06325 [Armatimonadota bacterium]
MEKFIQDGLLPLLAVAMIFGIPIVAILTAHQRKMTELIHRDKGAVNDQVLGQMHAEMMQMRSEINDLRDRVNQQAIVHDESLSSRISPPRLEQRQ